MLRAVSCLLAAAALVVALSPGAHAGETISGEGYAFDLPDGFEELMTLEGSGGIRIRSSMGSLPIEGVPEVRAYAAKTADQQPGGVLMLTRVDLKRSITSAEELGLDQFARMSDEILQDVEVRTRRVGEYDAIEMSAKAAAMDVEISLRMLAVACGDYVVLMVLQTSSHAFPDPQPLWNDLVASLEIQPGIGGIALFGLIAAGAIALLFVLNKIATLNTSKVNDYTGRFSRFQDQEGFGNSAPAFRPPGERPAGSAGQPASHRPPGGRTLPSRPAGALPHANPPTMPAPRGTSPAVTRPTPAPPSARPGLRPTLPPSGRWGD